jgi:hypothetical protein
MKTFLMAAVALVLMGDVAFGAAATPLTGGPKPTAAQKAEFTTLCLKNSGNNQTLCTCKAKLLDKLVDEAFMTLVLATMKGRTLPVEDSKNYAIYISQSNKVCAPGM